MTDARIDKLVEDMGSFQFRLDQILTGSGGNPGTDGATHDLAREFREFRTSVLAELESLRTRCTAQEEHIDRLETYSRRTCILLHGVPEDVAQSEEDCLRAAGKLFKDKLQLDIPVARMERAHRLGPRRDGAAPRARPIIVKFLCYTDKKAVFTNKKKLRGQPLTITESLTRTRLSILRNARAHFLPPNVWTADGKIIIKTDKSGSNDSTFSPTNTTKLITVTTQRELDTLIATSPAPESSLRNVNMRRPTIRNN
ncbi:hypothetical protein M8J77_020288 [Diaphorina citri]|nr:hypothetical protein M8J77_020288 [Diaphorina citri]